MRMTGILSKLAVAGVVASVIGAFYYLRIVYFMYFGKDGEKLDNPRGAILPGLLVASAALMVIGVVLNLFGIDGAAAAAAATLVQ